MNLTRPSKPQKELKRLFISHGEDSETLRELLAQTIAAHSGHKGKEASNPPQIMRFYGGQSELSDVLEAATSPVLFSPQCFILLYQYDSFRDKKYLTILVEKLHENNILFLIKEEKKFYSQAFEKKVHALPYAEIRIAFFPNEAKLQKRLQDVFKAASLTLDHEAFLYLTRTLLSEPMLIQTEIKKCLTYFSGKKQSIHITDLYDILSSDSLYASGDVIAAAFRPDKNIFLKRFLSFITSGGHLSELVPFLIKETQRIIAYHEEKKRGTLESDIFTRLRIYYRKHQQLLRTRAAQFSLHTLEKLLINLYTVDETLKTESHHTGILALQATINQKAKCQLERALLYLA